MKRAGFTLAEVLITLGIVGVVSALVLPTFTTKMQTAKVGPRLAKAVASFEQACIAILEDEETDSLSGGEHLNVNDNETAEDFFVNGLQNHMKGSYDSENIQFISSDGVYYRLVAARGGNFTNTVGKFNIENYGLQNPPHLTSITGMRRFTESAMQIDIDGDNGPNTPGRDRFFFQMMDDGSLRPWGGSWEDRRYRWNTGTNCPKNEKADKPELCAGHILENGLKVEYK